MKIKIFAFFSLSLLLFSTCKNDDDTSPADPTPPSLTVNDYFPLKVGNYWIYDVVKVDTSGVEEQFAYSDTIRIIGEEVVNGNTFFVAETDSWLSSSAKKDTILYRDSSSYLVDSEGNFFLTVNGDNSILQTTEYDNTPFVSEYRMADSLESYSVPAGTFECLDYQGKFFSSSPTEPFENYPVRIAHNCYAEGIGLVYQNIFYAMSIQNNYERRLKEYHLE